MLETRWGAMAKYRWSHDCKAMPHYGKPIRLVHVDIDRCIYCGEISPREQGRIDAASVALLKETSRAEPSGA